jgi:hypothetical protein
MLDKCTPSLLTEPPPSLPNGKDYRELAVKIREIARQTRACHLPAASYSASPPAISGEAITSTGQIQCSAY